MISGSCAPNLMPSTPFFAAKRTHSRAVSGVCGLAAIPALAAERTVIREDPRRDDLVLRRQLALVQVPVHRSARHAADGGHAVHHPQLVDVFGIARLAAAAVHVRVDEARHQVHAGAVDLLGALRRPAAFVDRHAGEADADDVGDAVVLDHDVHRPARRRAGAVDDGDAANHQAIERAFAVAGLAVRRRIHLLCGKRNHGRQRTTAEHRSNRRK